MTARLLRLLRALTCPGDSHEWRRDAWWSPADGSWLATDWTCRVCLLTVPE